MILSEGGGEPFPTHLKPRHQLPNTHQGPCATQSSAVPHSLLRGASCAQRHCLKGLGAILWLFELLPVTGEQRHLPAGISSS